MRKYLFAAFALLLVSVPAQATGFGVYGAWWDTDELEDAGGLGLSLSFPLNEVLGLEVRGTYFEEFSEDPLEGLVEGDQRVFEKQSLHIVPLEVGLRIHFAREMANMRPYVGVGASYHMLDSDFGDIDNEFGYYASLGSNFGDGEGADFWAEALYRKVEGTIDFRGDNDIRDSVAFDLDGLGVNLGVVWNW